MTEYGKTKLNKTIKEYVSLNEQKKGLEKILKPIGEEIKVALSEEGVMEWKANGGIAKLSETYTETIDKDMVVSRIAEAREAALKAFGGKLPPELDKLLSLNGCYKCTSSVRLTVKANTATSADKSTIAAA